jgi:phage shock protein PspC (stress-responsive transcriptional regulator)
MEVILNKKNKIELGFLAFAPFAAGIIISGLAAKNFTSVLGLIFNDAPFNEVIGIILRDYSFIFIFWTVSCILSLIQKVIYIILAVKNKRIKKIIKILYIICMVFFEIAVMIYFYLEVLHAPKAENEEEDNSVWID